MTGHEFDGATLDSLLSVARRAADAARVPCLRYFRAGVAVDDKAARGFDPVTAADRAAEDAIRAVISAARPDDAIVGEERPAVSGGSGVVWVIDPIDGTRSYISGAPSWGVLIAAGDAAGPSVGVIDQPFTGERFEGVSRGARREARWTRGAETRPLATRSCARLEDATLFTTYPEVGSPAERRGFEAARDRVRLTRYGLDCYAYALLALGCVDLVIEAGLRPYDVQALIPVVEGAGGVITDWRGGSCAGGGRVLAAGDSALHAQALRLLEGVA